MADLPRKTLAEWDSLARKEIGGAEPNSLVWQTPEGIPVKPLYTAADLEGLGRCEFAAGLPALSPRPARHDVRQPAVDDPPVCRLLDGRGVQRLLPRQSGGRPDGPVGRLRSRHPSRLRLRPSARRRRCRQGRRRDRFRRGHEDPVRRHPARPDERVDDHERRGAAGAGRLHRRRRGAGRAAGEALRHDPERHPQGVHGPQHLHLSARALDADRRRHHRLHGAQHAEVQLDLDLRLSHAGGRRDGGAGAGLHAGRRPRICARGAVARASRSTSSRRGCRSSSPSA